eukprot:6923443-Alexandrium_andersonii.AAC.1
MAPPATAARSTRARRACPVAPSARAATAASTPSRAAATAARQGWATIAHAGEPTGTRDHSPGPRTAREPPARAASTSPSPG